MCCFVVNHLEMIGPVASGQFASQPFLDMNDSRQDTEESIHATCTFPSFDFAHSGSADKPTFTIICDNDDHQNYGGRYTDMGIWHQLWGVFTVELY